MSYVYFIVGNAGDRMMCKIGFTRRHPNERCRDLQGSSPLELDIFGYIEGGVELERKFHRTFDALRVHGEWFSAEHKLRDFIYYLSGYGAAKRVTTKDELNCAIYDCIISGMGYPETDEEAYEDSADKSLWLHVAREFQEA